MGIPWRLVLGGVLLAWLAAPLQARTLELARLDADAPASQVVSGRLDGGFVRARSDTLYETADAPRWWRVRVSEAVASDDHPHLVMQSPGRNRIEAWLPGEAAPVSRSLFGDDADPAFSTRALTVPLPEGLQPGQSLYLRIQPWGSTPMRLSIQPLAAIQGDDLEYVAWRTMVLSTMVVLAILAFGFRIGLHERSYAYLALTLLCQAAYLAAQGGELRGVELFGHAIGADVRAGRLAGMLSIIASNLFIGYYLDLRQHRPWLMRILDACNALVGVLMLASLASDSLLIPRSSNMVLLASVATLLVAAASETARRNRAAYFLLLSLLPMMMLLALRVFELQGWWAGPIWLAHAYPLGFALSGLVLTVGLADKMQQLRAERDWASRLATRDALTGLLSRAAILQRLENAIEAAQRRQRPLSVVFFDIDHFKQVNDRHGHLVGDHCLRMIALRTRGKLRLEDSLGRYGGDELLAVLPDTTLEQALHVAEHLREAVNRRPLSIDGRVIETSLSLGVAQLQPGESFDRLLERVDTALYSSKTAGRDRVTGHREMAMEDA